MPRSSSGCELALVHVRCEDGFVMVIFRALVSTATEPEWGHKLVLHPIQLASSWPMHQIFCVVCSCGTRAADFVHRVPRVSTCNQLQPPLPWGPKVSVEDFHVCCIRRAQQPSQCKMPPAHRGRCIPRGGRREPQHTPPGPQAVVAPSGQQGTGLRALKIMKLFSACLSPQRSSTCSDGARVADFPIPLWSCPTGSAAFRLPDYEIKRGTLPSWMWRDLTGRHPPGCIESDQMGTHSRL